MKSPKKLFGLARKTFDALSSYTFVQGGQGVQRYLAGVAAKEDRVLETAIRQIDIEGMKGYGYDLHTEFGMLTHAWVQKAAHILYYTTFKPKDAAQKQERELIYMAQMPQKKQVHSGASSSSQN